MADEVEKSGSKSDDEDEDEEEENEDEDEDEESDGDLLYNSKDFENLVVGSDVRQVFSFINLYTARVMELELKLKPFIPDLMPAVGDIDAFIKVPRPDGLDDESGLTLLDEPSASRQSDASLLALRLRAFTKQIPSDTVDNLVPVRAATCARDIDNWISSVRDLRQETAGAQTAPSLPDIDRLMQEWDPEFEQALSHTCLPGPDLQCDLSQYVTLLCALLDIPVHGSKIASLHQLFSLYNEFRSSQHFKH